jgi:fibronectin type 3 domain-containing protein
MKKFTITLSLVMLFAGGGCFDDIEQAPLSIPDATAPAPRRLSAIVGDERIALSWESVGAAVGYRLYRSVDTAENPVLLASPSDTCYVDTDVQNGRSYVYSVSTVNALHLEGDRSVDIVARPGLYGLMINGGAAYTGSETVTLQLTAPPTAALMLISNTASFARGQWESFAPSRSWQLGDGDGAKSVYAKFKDATGSESSAVGDTITLDTYAEIVGITLTPVLPAYRSGDTVHFTLTVMGNETGGTALIGFENSSDVAALNDKGTAGDRMAFDGVYETDYRFPAALRGLDIVVTGAFTDRVGNEAAPFEAPTRISFTDPPAAIELVGAADSTTSSITIRWVASIDEHFRSYRIYRDTKPGVSENPDLLVRELDTATQTSYLDEGLMEGAVYYYRIFVVNDLSESAGSNQISAHTYDAYPDPVILDAPTSVGNGRATLSWSMNSNTDFKEYRLYRATQPGVTTSSQLVATITERERTYYDDSGLDLVGNTYFYRVYVVDIGGKNSRSNEVDTAP